MDMTIQEEPEPRSITHVTEYHRHDRLNSLY